MSWRRELAKLGVLFRRRKPVDDLAEEIRAHLAMEEQENRESGMSPEEAHYAALRKFGNVTRVKEDAWEVWSFVWLEQLWQDIRFGLHMLAKNPGFTVVAVLTLALGIGANTAMFSLVDAVLLEPPPYSHPERIVVVWEKLPGGERSRISTLNFLDWKNQNTVFEAMAALWWDSMALTGGDVPVELVALRLSAPYFSIFGARPLLGRTFAPDEDQPGKEHVVVLSHRVWENRFGANPSVIGRSIQLNGEAYTVIGVMPPKPFDQLVADLWVPLAFEPKEMTRDYTWLMVWARMKPGVTLEQAQQEMKVLGACIAHDYPQSNKGRSVIVDRYAEQRFNATLKSLIVLFAAVCAVLLMCCVNLANLVLVRGAEREVAVRSALGGNRGRSVRLFLTESVLLAGLGGMAGVFLGWGMMLGLKSWLPPDVLPGDADVRLNGSVLLFTAALVVVTGFLFGVVPALHGSRINLVESLKEGGRGATHGVTRKRVRSVLVGAEIALAFSLLSGAGLLLRSFDQLQEVNLGFDPTNVITMSLPMLSKDYPDGPRLLNYQHQVVDRVRAVPGVRNAALATAPPLRGWWFGLPFQIEGRPIVDRSNRPECGFKIVSPTYLSTVGMHMLKGRWLEEADAPGAQPVVVINETLARRYFKEQDPVGQRLRMPQIVPDQPALGPEIPWQVVGVVADEKVWNLAETYCGSYVSYKQSPTEFARTLVVRGEKDPTHLVKSIQSAVWQINKNQPFDLIKTVDQLKSERLEDDRARTVLLGIFGIVALMIAAIGVYGVMSNAVAQRTHEMGVRAALGASAWDQLYLVLKGGMTLTAIGIGIGIAGALALTRFLASLLFGVSPYDPWTLTVALLVLAAVAGAACFIPARRATKVDPMVALRYE
jgi:putative ABC transport system permease protein